MGILLKLEDVFKPASDKEVISRRKKATVWVVKSGRYEMFIHPYENKWEAIEDAQELAFDLARGDVDKIHGGPTSDDIDKQVGEDGYDDESYFTIGRQVVRVILRKPAGN